MHSTSPRKLKGLAWRASYKHLLSQFIPRETSTSAEFVAYQNAFRESLTNRLDYHLLSFGRNTRVKYSQLFYEDVDDDDQDGVSSFPELWQFMDVVLDGRFKGLRTYARLPHLTRPDFMLIPVIARHCPELERLNLDFSSSVMGEVESDDVKQVIQSLSSLSHLKSLTLYVPMTLGSCLRVIGTSCPTLSYLYVDTLRGKRQGVLDLVLGELLDDADLRNHKWIWSADQVLQSLRVPPELVSPFCSTLRHVNFGPECSPAALAFLLRHMPLLQTLRETSNNLPKAVLLFRDEPSLNHNIQKMCDELFIQAASRLERRPLRPVNSLIPLASSGPLSLVKLEFISLDQADVLEAVGSLCPSLKDVNFFGPSSISPEELDSILSKWPKLDNYTVSKGVGREHKEIIFKVFGPGLIPDE